MPKAGEYQTYGFWNRERDLLLNQMWRTYASAEEIIEALERLPGNTGMTPGHVKDRAEWLLVKRPADWRSVSARRQYGRPPMPTIEEVTRLREEGLSLSQIAAATHMSSKSAWLMLHREASNAR